LLDLPIDALLADGLALLSADVLQQRILEALTEYVRAYALRQPVVVVWEDVQWLDPSSLRALEALLMLAHDVPLLVLTAFRSGEGRLASLNQRLLNEGYRHKIVLRALDDDDGAQLLSNLLHGAELPTSTCQLFLAKAEGNPYYLEEMLRVLVDDGMIVRQHDRSVVVRPVVTLDVPNTLQGLIMARIDHLPPRHKRILQTAAPSGVCLDGVYSHISCVWSLKKRS
jgi:predicted ATPase